MRLNEKVAKWIRVFFIGLGAFLGMFGITVLKAITFGHMFTYLAIAFLHH